jgi:hypothetical protein
MSTYTFANNVKTTLAGAISSTATTVQLASSANFPTIPLGNVWPVTLNDQATGTIYEILYVTAISGSNLTVLRGQEGTSAVAWNVGDYAFGPVTAGSLASFANSSTLSGYVQLNPPSVQNGQINITGTVTATGGHSAFGGINVNGILYGATTGAFSGLCTAANYAASQAYGNTAISALPISLNGGAGATGIGPSSGLSSQGITGSMLAIGSSNTGAKVAVDFNGNMGIDGAFYGSYIILTNNITGAIGAFNNSVTAPTIVQNGTQVLSTLSSSTLSLSRSGSNYDIELGSQAAVGATTINHGNGGNPSISLPNYGTWYLEVLYGIQEINNSNYTISLSLSGGTITGGWISNANGITAFNSQSIVCVYGKGYTTINNQTLTWSFSVSGGSLNPGTQPWTVRATRIT